MAVTPWDVFLAGYYDGVITAEDRLSTPSGPYSMGLHAYWASKVSALNRAEAWMKEQTPSFDVIHIHPSYIEGRNDTVTSVEDLKERYQLAHPGPSTRRESTTKCLQHRLGSRHRLGPCSSSGPDNPY